jgi:hypothetical protein
MSGVVSVADVYTRAIKTATSRGQVVGEKNDLYVTIKQLEAILEWLKKR